jgi:hypothetical protein
MLPKWFKSPFAVPEKTDELQDIMEAIDVLGEFYHEQLIQIVEGFRDAGYLSPLGLKNLDLLRGMKYTDIPESNKKIIRAHGAVLLKKVMEKIVEIEHR